MKQVKIILVVVMMLALAPLVLSANLSYDSDKNILNFEYDGLNRVINQSSTSNEIVYFYDGNSNGTLTNVSNVDVLVEYEYDDRGRVVKETKTIDGISFEKSTTYDSMDRADSISGDQESLNLSYGNNSLLKEILDILIIDYNENGQKSNLSFSNGLDTLFTYDNKFRLATILTDSVQDLSYSYDSVGNILNIGDSLNSREFSMVYDDLNRIIYTNISDDLFGDLINYTYNEIGNLIQISVDGGLINYTYSAYAHAPTQVLSIPARIEMELVYPTSDINVTRNEFFNYTTKVCCYDKNCGEIEVSLDPPSWNVTSGDKFQFDSIGARDNSLVKINSTHYLNVYSGTGVDGYAVVLEVDGTTITKPGSAFEFDPVTAQENSAVKIDDTHYLNIYAGDGLDGYAVVLVVDGATITNGSSFEFDAINGRYPSVVKMNDTHYLVTYMGENDDGYAVVLEVDGTTITKPGSAFEFDTLRGQYNSLVKINDTHYLNTYGGDGSDGYAVVLEVDGTTITKPGSSFEFDTSMGIMNSLVKINDTHYLNTYFGEGGHGYAVVLVVDGTSISKPSSSFEFDELAGVYSSLVRIDANHYLNTYAGNDTVGHAVVLEVDGTSISKPSSSFEFDLTNGQYNSLVKINDTHYLNTYAGENIRGYSVVLIVDGVNPYDPKYGLVPTTSGSIPFYTNISNPYSISLDRDECQNVTWFVNATGGAEVTHQFFAFANLTSNKSISNITQTVNITIVKDPKLPTDSSPSVNLISPVNNSVDSDGSIEFNCSATDDNSLTNITLYENWSGGWHANETVSVSGTSNSTLFEKTLPVGAYKWNCLAFDNVGQSSWANANWTFSVSNQPEAIYNFSLVNVNGLNAVYEFRILNNNFTGSEFPWWFSPGTNLTNKSYTSYSLENGEDLYVLVEHNYSSSGNYTATVWVNVSGIYDVETLGVTI